VTGCHTSRLLSIASLQCSLSFVSLFTWSVLLALLSHLYCPLIFGYAIPQGNLETLGVLCSIQSCVCAAARNSYLNTLSLPWATTSDCHQPYPGGSPLLLKNGWLFVLRRYGFSSVSFNFVLASELTSVLESHGCSPTRKRLPPLRTLAGLNSTPSQRLSIHPKVVGGCC